MAINKLQVVNEALAELSFEPVATLDENKASQSISFVLDSLLPELLLRTDWNFAIQFVQDDTPLTTLISPDFQYNYQLPANYNRMDRFSWQTSQFQFYYRIIDDVIMTNSRPILYYYVVNNVDYSVIDPSFQRALVLYAAATRCIVLTQNAQLHAYLVSEYNQKLSDAIRKNDMDRYVQSTPYNDYDRQAYI